MDPSLPLAALHLIVGATLGVFYCVRHVMLGQTLSFSFISRLMNESGKRKIDGTDSEVERKRNQSLVTILELETRQRILHEWLTIRT